MKLLILIPVFLLSGCAVFKTTVPVTQKFPDSVPELMKKCEDLKTVEGTSVPITDMLKVIVENYSLYYQCSNKVDGWQEWYNEQKKIFDSVK